jgi:hypothetical protein
MVAITFARLESFVEKEKIYRIVKRKQEEGSEEMRGSVAIEPLFHCKGVTL